MVCADGVSRASRASRSSVGQRRSSTSAKAVVRDPSRVETPHEPCAPRLGDLQQHASKLSSGGSKSSLCVSSDFQSVS